MGTPKPDSHPHADLIKAWADGAKIQYFDKTYQTWIDVACNHPSWSKTEKYRIKPEANETWKPKEGDEYWALDNFGDVFFSIFCDSDDEKRYSFGNCFRTRAEAEAAAERVKAAMKGATDVNANVDNPELDGKPMTNGEVMLIKTIRSAGIKAVFEDKETMLNFYDSSTGEIDAICEHVSFTVKRGNAVVIHQLKKIKAEQEASNEA